MHVLKFGGTSVANAENINKVVTLVLDALKKDKTILVASALGGITCDMLISRPASRPQQAMSPIKKNSTR